MTSFSYISTTLAAFQSAQCKPITATTNDSLQVYYKRLPTTAEKKARMPTKHSEFTHNDPTIKRMRFNRKTSGYTRDTISFSPTAPSHINVKATKTVCHTEKARTLKRTDDVLQKSKAPSPQVVTISHGERTSDDQGHRTILKTSFSMIAVNLKVNRREKLFPEENFSSSSKDTQFRSSEISSTVHDDKNQNWKQISFGTAHNTSRIQSSMTVRNKST